MGLDEEHHAHMRVCSTPLSFVSSIHTIHWMPIAGMIGFVAILYRLPFARRKAAVFAGGMPAILLVAMAVIQLCLHHCWSLANCCTLQLSFGGAVSLNNIADEPCIEPCNWCSE